MKRKLKKYIVSLSPKQIDFDFSAGRNRYTITLDKKNEMKEYCSKHKISLPVLFEAATTLYSARINNADDVTLCSLVLNRSGMKEKSTMGMYNNIVPMTTVVDWNNTFVNLCDEISKEHFQVFRHQRYPFNNIMNLIRERYGQSSVYDIMISYQNAEVKSMPLITWHVL